VFGEGDGSDQLVLASLGASGALAPSFSHSGNELCFNSQVRPRDIYIVNIDGTGLTNLTETNLTETRADNFRCDWSPTSNSIAFGSTRDGNEEIYVMDADGTDVVRLTGDRAADQPDAPGADANPAWSPQGDRIAFESNRSGNFEIFTITPQGIGAKQIGSNPASDNAATWSSDVLRLVFTSNRTGTTQVFVMDRDGANVIQLTFGGSSNQLPSWGS